MVSYSDYESDSRVRRYGETLVKHGYRVDALALNIAGKSTGDVVNGVRVFRIQNRVYDERSKFTYLRKLLLFFARSMFFLTREHLRDPYDKIHIHSVPDFLVFAALVPKLTGCQVILDIHDILPEFYASKFKISTSSPMFKLLLGVERASAAFADHVIAANHIWQDRLRQRSAKNGKCTALLNYPDTQIFTPRGRTRSDGKFVILFPGTLNYHQGVDLAVRAFAKIKDRAPQAEFQIYGTGEQQEFLRSLITDLGLQDRVFLRDFITSEKIASIMENADLGVVPKRKNLFGNEAFSTKILEFMCLGVPVVIPDTTVDRYYFNPSVARFFSGNDEDSLAASMLYLIENPDVREAQIQNANEFVKKYTWAANESRYFDILDGSPSPTGTPAKTVEI
jgi:glycosyltransferase involved in cell wall biosynthesis